MLGGRLQKSSESMTGPLTRYCIQQTHFHKAFIGADGWHPKPVLPVATCYGVTWWTLSWQKTLRAMS